MQPKLIISFEEYSEARFLARVVAIAASLVNSTDFPAPWPGSVLAPAALATAVANYQAAYKEASHGDRVKIAVRKGLRVQLTIELKKIAAYLEIVAAGDVGLLVTTGFELRRDIVRGLIVDPPSPMTGLKVTRGVLSGVLVFHAKADPTVSVYNLQIASGDPAVEANWSDVGSHKHCNRIQLTGLTPGKLYYMRIRGFNKNGYGPWTVSTGIVAL